MLCGELEQGERLFEILFPPDSADTIRIAIRQKVLRVRVSTRTERLEQRDGLADQVVPFLLVGRIVPLRAGGSTGSLERFSGFDQEDGEFECYFGVVCLFRVGTVEFELLFVREECGGCSWAEMGCKKGIMSVGPVVCNRYALTVIEQRHGLSRRNSHTATPPYCILRHSRLLRWHSHAHLLLLLLMLYRLRLRRKRWCTLIHLILPIWRRIDGRLHLLLWVAAHSWDRGVGLHGRRHVALGGSTNTAGMQ